MNKCIFLEEQKVKIKEIEKEAIKKKHIRVKTIYSAVSTGTELGLLNNSNLNARQKLGYSAVGKVVELGSDLDYSFEIGDIVACYGSPYVYHGKYLMVPQNLCKKVPENVSLKEAAFIGLGAIAIHGIRKVRLQFGESVLVIGLGLLGQIISQICQQSNYQVIGTDLLEERCDLIKKYGVKSITANQEENMIDNMVKEISNGYGVDGVIISAHSKNKGIIDQALKWVSNNGKIVIVGNLDMNFSRNLFFQKEADLMISRAGGPGRYDEQYEIKGSDYPYNYIRWTEGRNMEEYLRLLKEEKLVVKDLITDIFPFENAVLAYNKLSRDKKSLGVLFEY